MTPTTGALPLQRGTRVHQRSASRLGSLNTTSLYTSAGTKSIRY